MVHFVAEVLLIDRLEIKVKFWKHFSNEKFIPTDEVSFVMKPDVVFCLLKPVPVCGTSSQSGKFAFGINLHHFHLNKIFLCFPTFHS